MNRNEFLADPNVEQFVAWAGHLVRGEWGLKHFWSTAERFGGRFACCSLYRAYRRYNWLHLDFARTMDRFDDFRKRFEDICPIATYDDKRKFLVIAREIAVDWGGSTRLDLNSSRNWGGIPPATFQEHIDEIKQKLAPKTADTERLPRHLRMGAGFSKIYSALVPGWPIYDSRVACALACLVERYRLDACLPAAPPSLNLGIPQGRGNSGDRCGKPQIQGKKHAEANLKFAWLLDKLAEDPGEFAAVREARCVDALQSALFMLGHTQLSPCAVVKNRRRSSSV